MNETMSHTALPEATPSRSDCFPLLGWTAGRVTAIVIGALLVPLLAGLAGRWGNSPGPIAPSATEGYATTDVHEFSASAQAGDSVDRAGIEDRWPARRAARQIRMSRRRRPFVGIGPSTDVDRYLTGVHRTVINEFWVTRRRPPTAARPLRLPDTGLLGRVLHRLRPADLEWDPTDGSWTVVVMNADGRHGIDVGADLGAKLPALPWIGLGVLIAGAVFPGRRRAPDRGCDPRPPRQPSEHGVSKKGASRSCSRSRKRLSSSPTGA